MKSSSSIGHGKTEIKNNEFSASQSIFLGSMDAKNVIPKMNSMQAIEGAKQQILNDAEMSGLFDIDLCQQHLNELSSKDPKIKLILDRIPENIRESKLQNYYLTNNPQTRKPYTNSEVVIELLQICERFPKNPSVTGENLEKTELPRSFGGGGSKNETTGLEYYKKLKNKQGYYNMTVKEAGKQVKQLSRVIAPRIHSYLNNPSFKVKIILNDDNTIKSILFEDIANKGAKEAWLSPEKVDPIEYARLQAVRFVFTDNDGHLKNTWVRPDGRVATIDIDLKNGAFDQPRQIGLSGDDDYDIASDFKGQSMDQNWIAGGMLAHRTYNFVIDSQNPSNSEEYTSESFNTLVATPEEMATLYAMRFFALTLSDSTLATRVEQEFKSVRANWKPQTQNKSYSMSDHQLLVFLNEYMLKDYQKLVPNAAYIPKVFKLWELKELKTPFLIEKTYKESGGDLEKFKTNLTKIFKGMEQAHLETWVEFMMLTEGELKFLCLADQKIEGDDFSNLQIVEHLKNRQKGVFEVLKKFPYKTIEGQVAHKNLLNSFLTNEEKDTTDTLESLTFEGFKEIIKDRSFLMLSNTSLSNIPKDNIHRFKSEVPALLK
jgi:hypothetical protein